MNRPGTTDTRTPPPGNPANVSAALDFPRILDRMTAVERLRAYRTGAFDRRERAIWAARFPEEAPLLNGELEWIARNLADLEDEAGCAVRRASR